MDRIGEDRREQFVRRLSAVQPVLRGYLGALGLSYADREDLLQEISVELWRALDRYDFERPFAPWALGVARHAVLMHRRQHARHPLCVDSNLVELYAERAAHLAPELDRRRERLRECLQRLPDAQRRILQLRYEEDLPPEAIAPRIQRSEAAVHTLLSRIRAALAACVSAGRLEGQSGV